MDELQEVCVLDGTVCKSRILWWSNSQPYFVQSIFGGDCRSAFFPYRDLQVAYVNIFDKCLTGGWKGAEFKTNSLWDGNLQQSLLYSTFDLTIFNWPVYVPVVRGVTKSHLEQIEHSMASI